MRRVQKVKLLRITHGFTQAGVAEVLDIHTSTYTKKENGQIPFSIKEISILKDFYKLSNDEVAEIFLNNIVG